MGGIEREAVDTLLSAFFQEALEDFEILPFDEATTQFSFELVLQEDLRTLDSLQLSAAMLVEKEADPVFVTADEELQAVADKRGLNTLNPLQE